MQLNENPRAVLGKDDSEMTSGVSHQSKSQAGYGVRACNSCVRDAGKEPWPWL